MKKDCAVLITAAGFSGRMGVSKALLKWNEEMNFLEKLIHSYTAFGCNEIIVCLNEDDFHRFYSLSIPNIIFVLNSYPERERMYSIQLGLRAIQKSAFCFIQAIDNPFIDEKILNQIYTCREEDYFISPNYKGKSGHPVLVSKSIIDYICKLEIKKQHFNEMLEDFPRKNIPLEYSEILININTEEDCQRYFNSK